MGKLTIEDLQNGKGGSIIFGYVAGSHLYSLNTPKSDFDIRGVYLTNLDTVLGLPKFYQGEVSDEKSDITYYEIEKYLYLLSSSNPNVLESLFVPEDKILYKDPIMDVILENRDKFLTKQCFNPFIAYAIQQIKRARGLNKKIVNPVYERKTVLDFCYTTHEQGSINISNWLKEKGLKQSFCGLVSIPNMRDTYGVYYDWGMHKQFLIDNDCSDNNKINLVRIGEKLGAWPEPLNPWFIWDNVIKEPLGYKGIVKDVNEVTNESNDVRLSSVEKNVLPICHMTFNKDGYVKHCKDYNQYKIWEHNRNPVRYESNLNKNYDAKNIMHSFRLLTMGLEIARGEGFNVMRTHDKEFLMKIRNHEFEYDELIEKLDGLKSDMENAMANSRLPDAVDERFVNDLLVDIRKQQIADYENFDRDFNTIAQQQNRAIMSLD
jgi:hypothetical protein